MPSKSKAQHNFMEAIAHSPSFAKKAGVPQSVGKDFAKADKGHKFKGGGMATKMKMFEKSSKDKEKGMREGSKKEESMDRMQMMGMKKGGMAEGGKSDTAQDKAMIKKAFKQHDMQEHKGGKGTSLKLAKGGTFRASANGIATKGKTKGTQIKMSMGGKAC